MSGFVSRDNECEKCLKQSPNFFCCHKVCGICSWRKACNNEYKDGKCPKEKEK